MALLPANALAGTVSGQRPLLFSFDGADAAAGRFSTAPEGVGSIAVDNQSGAVYVAAAGYPEGGFVSKFHPDGSAWDFGACGCFSLTGFSNLLGVAVDNSRRAGYQSDLLVSQYGDPRLRAFGPDGSFLWTLTPVGWQPVDVAVDASGHPWLIPVGLAGDPTEYESSGSPPAPSGCSIATGAVGAIELDAAGNVYLREAGGIRKFTRTGPCAFAESLFDPSAVNVYADQSSPSGDIFTVEGGAFSEYSAAGAELGSYGSEYVRYGRAIAYNPAKDWVYVAQGSPSNRVAVFGPPASGTVPDASEASAVLTGEGISSAHFSGKIDPQGTSSAWHFEWKKASQAWDEAEVSPSQPLPADFAEHAVSFDTEALRGNTTYELRLVGVDSGSNLAGFSSAATFTTKKAPAAPEVTSEAVSAIGTTTARAEAQINPKGDTADWRVQLSESPRCGEGVGFSNEPLQTIDEGTSSPVGVHYELSGLLPSQRYCVRFMATNSAGTTVAPGVGEAPLAFETGAVPPSHVETAFVAPRLDRSARLNGYANPEGEDLTYRFELSKDGGATWRALKEHEDRSEARNQILLSSTESEEETGALVEELTDLRPGTTYSYRLAAENAADRGAPVLGEVKTFTTRTREEVGGPRACPRNEAVRAVQRSRYLPDCRAFELVNSPDKGGQDVQSLGQTLSIKASPYWTTTAAGGRAVWSVRGGAKWLEASDSFLARRTGPSAAAPNGWESQPVAPPAAQPPGGAAFAYALRTATPNLGRFFANTKEEGVQSGMRALVRIGGAGGQEVLSACPALCIPTGEVDVTADGAHAVGIDSGPEPHRLYDVGSGTPQLLSVMPDGQPNECRVEGNDNGGYYGSGGGWTPNWRPGYQAIAATDASRVYFEAQPNGSGCGPSVPAGLYVRNRETGKTTLIDPNSPTFVRATPDGRAAYFVTESRLDPADGNLGRDVYRWDEASGKSTCLTCVVPDAEVRRYVAVSDDFSRIYFASGKQLVPGRGKAGDLNLYVLHHGKVGFVADPNDAEGALAGPFTTSLSESLLSHDGSVLLFSIGQVKVGRQEVTADRLAETCRKEEKPIKCFQLDRYDDRDGSLECLTCRHGGVTTHPAGEFAMSADGSTVAFETEEALVRRDVDNGPDLYEWRNGAVHLISNGVSKFAARKSGPHVFTLDATGRNIFFTEAAPGLTGFEQDTAINLYDARIGGGWLSLPAKRKLRRRARP